MTPNTPVGSHSSHIPSIRVDTWDEEIMKPVSLQNKSRSAAKSGDAQATAEPPAAFVNRRGKRCWRANADPGLITSTGKDCTDFYFSLLILQSIAQRLALHAYLAAQTLRFYSLGCSQFCLPVSSLSRDSSFMSIDVIPPTVANAARVYQILLKESR